MAETPSKALEPGRIAPDFSLPNTNPNFNASQVSLADLSKARGLVVAFICNHCPYVIKIKSAFAEFASDYANRGISVVAISSNDVATHPADSPQNMSQDAVTFNYSFPYLYDESQTVAKAYDAVCTPDFFLFDEDRKLIYRGQFDDSRPGNTIPASGSDLRAAADALLSGQSLTSEQKSSVGCSIKWKR